MKKNVLVYLLRAVVAILGFIFALNHGISPANYWISLIAGISVILVVFQFYHIGALHKENRRLLKAIIEIRRANEKH